MNEITQHFHFEFTGNDLQVKMTYSKHVKEVFAQTAAKARDFIVAPEVVDFAAQGSELMKEWCKGLCILDELAQPDEPVVHLKPSEIQAAHELSALVAIHRDWLKKDFEAASSAFFILAQALPCPIEVTPDSLPPGKEIWSSERPSVWAFYEEIRKHDGAEVLFVSVGSAFLLYQHLLKSDSLDLGVLTLVTELEEVTKDHASAVEALFMGE